MLGLAVNFAHQAVELVSDGRGLCFLLGQAGFDFFDLSLLGVRLLADTFQQTGLTPLLSSMLDLARASQRRSSCEKGIYRYGRFIQPCDS